ncbi:protein-tyrosine phosphatase [Micrococcales bacterium KH10]|nr:protein-tyrosine phosphatase [Micrococcales bacterium KH10]
MGTKHAIASPSLKNLRDPGGVDGPSAGQGLRPGIVFRSAAPTDPAIATDGVVAALNIGTVLDLRTSVESAEQPDQLPAGATLRTIDVLASSPTGAAVQQTRMLADPVRFAAELANFPAREAMEQTYRQLVSSESALLGYAEVLQTIIAEPDAPVLIHCTAGKDRTGWAIALLMSVAGNGDEAIYAEYLAVNEAVADLFAPLLHQLDAAGVDSAMVKVFFQVQRSYLEAAFDEVNVRFGGLNGYLTDGLGLSLDEIAALRRHLTGTD